MRSASSSSAEYSAPLLGLVKTRSGDAQPVAFFEQEAIKTFLVNDLTVMRKIPPFDL